MVTRWWLVSECHNAAAEFVCKLPGYEFLIAASAHARQTSIVRAIEPRTLHPNPEPCT